MKALEEILKKYEFPIRDSVSLILIEDVEKYANLKLPEDYTYYLENHLGVDQFIGNEFIKLWSLEEIIAANKDYNIVAELSRTIGIGTNGGGEFIGIEFNSEDVSRIIISPFIDLNVEYHIEIGQSFTDFLVRLNNGIEWFS